MGRDMTRRLALLVLGVVCLMPVGAFAGPPCDSVPGPGPVVSATHYSPWHYRTPLLYRCWLEHHYGVTAGKCGPGCYALAPSSAPAIQDSGSAAEPGTRSEAASPAAAAATPEATGLQQGR